MNSLINSKPLTQAQCDRIAKLRERGYSWKRIALNMGISEHQIDKYYRGLPPLGQRTERIDNRIKEPTFNRVSRIAKDDLNPIYDPTRDGVAKHRDLTAILMGDPPPGRRELIESQFGNTTPEPLTLIPND